MLEGVSVELPLDAKQEIESPVWRFGGCVQYDETATTPISRWVAFAAFIVATWIARFALNRLPRWHPFRIFHEGHLALRAPLMRMPMRGILRVGVQEPRYITTVKLVAIFMVAYAALSVVFDLGRLDLFGFDLIHIHFAGSDA